MTDALRLAFGTLTALPTPPPGRVDPGVARLAMLVAPVAVLPLALVWTLGHLVVRISSVPPLLVGVILVGCTALYSRGLHLDGLADTADGLSAGYDRERALAVMKTGDVGPSGAGAIVLAVLVQSVAVGALLTSGAGTALAVIALVASRHVLAWGCSSRVPTARATGLGATVGGTVPTGLAATVTAAGLVAAAVLGQRFGAPWYAGAATVIGGLAATAYVLRTAIRRIGGMTGDVLGACVEIALAASLVTATALLS